MFSLQEVLARLQRTKPKAPLSVHFFCLHSSPVCCKVFLYSSFPFILHWPLDNSWAIFLTVCLSDSSIFTEKKKCTLLYPQTTHTVTNRCGVWLLTTQKSINRPGWWEGEFALFQMPATGGEGRHLSKGQLPLLAKSGVKAFVDRTGGRGPTCKSSRVSSDSHFHIGHSWSDQCMLIVSGTVNLQF